VAINRVNAFRYASSGGPVNELVRKLHKLLTLLPHKDFRTGLFSGVAAGIEHQQMLESYRFDTIIDVGANIGQFSLIARHHNPTAVIDAFEPIPSAALKYEALFSDDASVQLHRVALGDKQGKLDLHLSRRMDSSSLLPIGSEQVTRFPGTDEVGTISVKVMRLDDVLTEIRSPVLLKLDVQGYELNVLKGAEKLMDKIDAVYTECSWLELYEGQALISEVAEYLEELGFKMEAQYNTVSDQDGNPVQADILFMR